MADYTLSVDVEADARQFDQAMRGVSDSLSEAGDQTDHASGKMSTFGDVLKASLAADVIEKGIGLLTDGLKNVVSAIGDLASYGDNIDKMSQKMGMSAETYQEWDAVMQHSGTSMDAMKSSMKTLATAAESGNAAFSELGITQEELASLNQEELFERTISALQDVESDTQRTYLAGKLLGRGATELGALLNTSAEDTQAMRDRVHELGGVMSDEAVSASAAYQDSLQDMQTAVSGFTRGLVAEFLPGVTTVMDGIANILSGDTEGGLGQIKEGIKGLGETFVEEVPEFVKNGAEIAGAVITGIIDMLPELGAAALEMGGSLLEGLDEKLPDLITQGFDMLIGFVSGLLDNQDEVVETGGSLVDTLLDTLLDCLPAIIDGGWRLLLAIIEGIITNLPDIAEAGVELIGKLGDTLVEHWPDIRDAGGKILLEIAGGIIDMLGDIGDAADQIGDSIWESIQDIISDAATWGWDIVSGIADGIWDALSGSSLVSAASSVASTISSFLGFSEPETGPLSDFHTYMPDMIKMLTDGMRAGQRDIALASAGLAGSIAGGLTPDGIIAGTGTAYNYGDSSTTNSNVFNITVSGGSGSAREIADAVSDEIMRRIRRG